MGRSSSPEFDAYIAKLERPPKHLDFTLLTELERGTATATRLANSRDANTLGISEAGCEAWLKTAEARDLVSRVQEASGGDVAGWGLTDKGRVELAALRDEQRLLPRAMWGPFALAARDGLALGIKTYVAAAPIALIAWWWGLINVSKWWVPVISAVIPLLLLSLGALFLLWRRNRARTKAVRGQIEAIQAGAGAYAVLTREAEASVERMAASIEREDARSAERDVAMAESRAKNEAARRKLDEESN